MAAAKPPLQSAEASPRAYVLLLAAVLLAVSLARVRLLGVPLERDEGEFAYQGLLLLKGHAPFDGLYTMKLPGVGLLYALFILAFGRSALAIHLGLLACNLACVWLVWRLGRRLLGAEAGLAAAAAFALLSVSQGVLGVFAHATQFVVLFSLAACLLLLRFRDDGRLAAAAAAGLCFGLAVLMKQHAVLLAAFGLAAVVAFGMAMRRAAAAALAFIAGAALPLVMLGAWLLAAGTGARAWLWCVEYAREYVSLIGPRDGIALFLARMPPVASFEAPLWLAAAIGLILLLARASAQPPARPFLLGFFAASLAAMSPGFYFRPHYFVLLLPALALLAGLAIAEAGPLLLRGKPDSALRRALGPVLLALLLLWGLVREAGYLFVVAPAQVSRQIYWPNPFLESVVVGDYLQRHGSARDRVAVLGSEPQIFFYSDRLSATGYIYMYGLMEPQPFAREMQADMMREIEAAKPRFLVLVNVPTSWLVRPDSARDLLQWASAYTARHYQLDGLVEVRKEGPRAYWGRDAARAPTSPYYVTVWQRDPAPGK